MPVFKPPMPEHLRGGPARGRGSVFLGNAMKRWDERAVEDEVYRDVSCDLPLQMVLYFDIIFFPFWWISEVIMLDLKFPLLPAYYQCLTVTSLVLTSIFEMIRVYLGYTGNLKEKFPLLPAYYQCLTVTGLVLTSIFEMIRVYLGYTGNLKEKVPELAGFWLISVFLQLPILLFFLTDEGLMILPLEWAVHSVYLALLLGEVLSSLVALRRTSRVQALRFHLEQVHPGHRLPTGGTSHGARAVLPMLPVRDVRPQC